MQEIWKPIKGYEGIYEVSNLGVVRGLKRKVWNGKAYYYIEGKELKSFINNRGYHIIRLYKNVMKRFLLHRIVAETFINNKDNYNQVNHLDEDKDNNKCNNLQWCNNRINQNYSANKLSTSKYPGVCWCKQHKKWASRCRHNGKRINFGYFNDEKEAFKAYKKYCEENNIIYKL